jgi:hypothetical protein
MCRGRPGHLFPYLPHQPGYHKRVKAAAPLICKTTLYLAALTRNDDRYRRTPMAYQTIARSLRSARTLWLRPGFG